MTAEEHFDTIFVGAGPSGIGPLVNAAGTGRLEEVLAEPVAVVDAGSEIGPGSIGKYRINTNSRGGLFLEALRDERAAGLAGAARSEVAAAIRSRPEAPVSMQALGELLRLMGRDIAEALERARGSSLLLERRVERVTHRRDGRFVVETAGAGGRQVLGARQLVLGTGARPVLHDEPQAVVLGRCRAGVPALHSDEFLTREGFGRAVSALAQRPGGKVLIVGGGDSAFSAAWLLLRGPLPLADGAIVMAHRRTPRVTFESAAEAHAAGYEAFGPEDICPQSGIVFRIGGLRFDQAELYLRIRSGAERRVRLAPVGEGPVAQADIDWDSVAVAVFATGYAPSLPALTDEAGRPLELMGTRTGKYVDGASRLLLAGGEVLPNAYAIGMCSGFLPMEGGFGGEPSFDGLANSIMLCHGAVGAAIVEGLLAGRRGQPSARVPEQAGWPA